MRERGLVRALGERTKRRLSPRWCDYLKSADIGVALLPIPKNANSYLKALILLNNSATADFDPVSGTALAYMKRSKRPQDFRVQNWQELRSADYTRLLAIRDPAKRLVSCFCDKLVKASRDEKDVDGIVESVNRRLGLELGRGDITFRHFVEYISVVPDYRRERHYRSQSYYISGNRFDVVINLDDGGSLKDKLKPMGFERFPSENSNASVIKKTVYNSRPAGEPVTDLSLSELQSLRSLPHPCDFFDDSLFQVFLGCYHQDIVRYLQHSEMTMDTYMRRIVNG